MLDVLTKGCNKFKVDYMETAIILGSLVLILLCNISWHLYCKDEESKHKKVESLLNDKLISQHDELNLLTHKIKILEQYMKDVCSGDSEREENAKYLYRVTNGWTSCNSDNEWAEKELVEFQRQMSEIINWGSRKEENINK